MTSTLLSLLLLSVLIASISATTTITIERTENHTSLIGTYMTGNILIDGQSYGKTMELAHLGMYPNTPNNPFYSVEKVFIYELKPPCFTFDCARAGLNSQADEVFIIPHMLLAQKHIRVGSSIQKDIFGTPVGMGNPTQTFNSIMAKLGQNLDDNNVQLQITENY